MNISQIRYFVTAAQLQNLSKASEALHLSQPALSKSIAKLEEELGTELFIRNGKRIVLNDQGRRFLESAWVILRHVDNTMLDLSEMSIGSAARLTVGMYQPDERITECIARFMVGHPDVEIDVNCFIDSDEKLDINKYDMLLYPDGSRYERFRGFYLGNEPYLLAMPAGHPLSREKLIEPEMLRSKPFIFMSREQRYIEEPYYLCAGLNLRPRANYFTNAREQHRQIISSGVALGFVPEGCAFQYKKDDGLCLRPISDSRFSRRIMLCFKREKYLTQSGREFQEFMSEALNLGGEQK
ncbi:MAG: LysR family transcriptional regulator [Ruminococcaceae bacterium]|nr:LysR family transcriptional regulator [Oscillospiraceae bacterium]